jgi:hypothetical protein
MIDDPEAGITGMSSDYEDNCCYYCDTVEAFISNEECLDGIKAYAKVISDIINKKVAEMLLIC